MSLPLSSRRAGRVIAAALASVLAGAALLAAPPALAEVQDGPMTMAAEGGVNSINAFRPAIDPSIEVTGTLNCPAGTFAHGFLSEPGKEEIDLSVDPSFDNIQYLAQTYSGAGFFEDGVLDPSGAGGQYKSGNWTEKGFRQSNLVDFLEAGKTYSAGFVCGDGRYNLTPGADGKSIVIFGTLTVDAAKELWTFSVPKKASTTTLMATTGGAYAAKLTATVPAAATGEVEFFEGATSVGKAPVSQGKATLDVTTLSVGSHSFTATYLGDATFDASAPSEAASVEIVFVKLDSQVGITAALEGEASASLTATLTAAGETADDATGTVEFFVDGDSVGTADVKDGVAKQGIADLAPGKTYAVTAKYAGNDKYTASTSTTPATLTTPAAPIAFSAGDKLVPGTRYLVEAPAGTFVDGDTVAGVVNSDPIVLTETAVAGSDGAATYVFTLPTELAESTETDHTLVLTGTPSGRTYTLAFVIDTAATPTPSPTPGNTGGSTVPAGSSTPNGGGLAVTGADGNLLALGTTLGAGALILGAAAVIITRRRRTTA